MPLSPFEHWRDAHREGATGHCTYFIVLRAVAHGLLDCCTLARVVGGENAEQQRAARLAMTQRVAVGQVAPFLASMAAAVARMRDEQGLAVVEEPTHGWEPPESWGRARRVLGAVVEALSTGLVHAGLAIVEALPPNWPPEVTLHDLHAIERMAVQDGLPVAWVPRSPLLRALADAGSPDARLRLLADSTETVADDCIKVLEASAGADTDEFVGLAREAVSALREGHAAAAQSLAAEILDACVSALVTKAARNDAAHPLHDRPLAAMRTAIALAPLNTAFATYKRGGPVPATFNRHASVHAPGSTQYRTGNAPVAVMLVTSVLREHREQSQASLGAHGVDRFGRQSDQT